MARPCIPCADCAQPMNVGKGSLPEGLATCQPCRRARNPKRPASAAAGTTGTCRKCGVEFVRIAGNQAYCRMPCTHPRSGTSHKPASPTERGYGTDHMRARDAAKAAWQSGDPCARCSGPMYHGTPVDLDHTDDRSGYLGLSHASCNRSNTGRLQSVRVQKVCDHCGLTYTTRHAEQRYCTVTCRKAAPKLERVPRAKPVRVPELRQCGYCNAMHVRSAKYCCQSCATQANRESARARYAPRPRVEHHYDCVCCGVSCVSPRPTTKYCSRSCERRAAKRRQAGKPERSPVITPRTTAPRAA